MLLFILVFQFFEAFCQDPKPPISINLSELTVSQIHSAYKKGEYTSENLVQAYLDRITKLNDTINALTAINPEALAIARQLDEEFAKTGKLRPLHGIPIIVNQTPIYLIIVNSYRLHKLNNIVVLYQMHV